MHEKTNFEFIDIHSHLNLSPLYEDREAILSRMREKKVATITVGVDFETSKRNVEIAAQNPDVWACIGIHPADNTEEVFIFEKYLELARHEKVVAIGECGLDYFRSHDSGMKEKQRELFSQQIELAQKVSKPLMIHARPSKGTMDAYEDAIGMLRATPTASRATR